MSRDQAQAFFTRYRDAFSAGDGDAVLFCTACTAYEEDLSETKRHAAQ